MDERTKGPMCRAGGEDGFTLAEILIVVALIAVLAAVGIPILFSRLGRTRETVCLSNRQSLTRQLRYEMMTEGLTGERAEEIKGSFEAICPEDGAITIDLTPRVTVSCSIHGVGGGEAEDSGSAAVKEYLQNFIDFVNEKHDTVGNSNNRLRDEFFETYGHPTMEVEGVTYHIEPFYNQHSSGEYRDRIWLFAKTTSGNGNWNGSFVYHAGEDQWYQAMKKYDGSAPQPAFIGGYDNVSSLVDALENERCDKGEAKRWRPVSDSDISYSN